MTQSESALPPSLAAKLMFLAVCLVPFQQAFTLDVGFPLKLSEVLGAGAVAGFLVDRSMFVSRYVGAVPQWLLGTFVTVSAVVWLGAGANLLPAASNELASSTALAASYAIIVVTFAWFAGTRLGAHWIRRGFRYAVRFAFAYCVLQLVAHLAGATESLAAISGTSQLGSAFGILLPRNGPFLEGNYLGIFAGVAIFMALRSRDRLGAIFAFSLVIYSQSTISMIAVLVAAMVVALTRPSSRLFTVLSGAGLAIILALWLVPAANEYVRLQLAKLGFGETDSYAANIDYSLTGRSGSIEQGIKIGVDHLWLGVGPGRFGYWDDMYGGVVGPQGIANNVYVQVFAEAGVFALTALICFLLMLLSVSWKSSRASLAMITFLIVAMNAAPSWTILTLWFPFAYLATQTTASAPNAPQRPSAAPAKERSIAS